MTTTSVSWEFIIAMGITDPILTQVPDPLCSKLPTFDWTDPFTGIANASYDFQLADNSNIQTNYLALHHQYKTLGSHTRIQN